MPSTKSSWIVPAVLGTVILALIIAMGTVLVGHEFLRNQLIALDAEAEAQWKQVEAQLVRQNELIPKLVTVVTAYADYESDVIQGMMEARQYFESEGPEKMSAGGEMESALYRIIAVAEQYPQIKANIQFRDLSYEIAGTKNRIATERMRYNEAVRLLNMRLKQFPWSYASEGICPREFFNPTDEQMLDLEVIL